LVPPGFTAFASPALAPILPCDNGGRLIYTGRVGTDFSDAELRRVHDLLEPFRVPKMPFDAVPPRATRFGSPLKLSRAH